MMGGMNFRDASEFDPETYGGEGGGLPAMLRRYLQQQNQQQGVDFGSTPSGAREYSLETTFSSQGGLLGRLLSLQAEQSAYRPFAENGGQAPPVSSDPNFRQLARIPNSAQPPRAIGPSNMPNDQSSPAYSPLGGDLAVRPERPLSDRLHTWWDHPHPHGLAAVLQEAQGGVRQAVQSSIDATSMPSTEEEAFRQNLGRELGPIGAFKAATLQAPLSPAKTSEAWRFLADLLMSRAASSAVAGINPLNPKSSSQQQHPTGGLARNSNGDQMPQWPFP